MEGYGNVQPDALLMHANVEASSHADAFKPITQCVSHIRTPMQATAWVGKVRGNRILRPENLRLTAVTESLRGGDRPSFPSSHGRDLLLLVP